MDCEHLTTQFDEARTLADLDALAADPVVRLHLADCLACRAEFAATRCAFAHFAVTAALAKALPETLVEANEHAIFVAIRDRRRPCRSLPAWLPEPAAVAAVFALAVAIAAVALVLLCREPAPSLQADLRPSAIDATGGVQPPPAGSPTTDADAEGSREAIAEATPAPAARPPAVSLAELQAEFAALKDTDAGVDHAFLERLLDFMETADLEGDPLIDLHKLLVATYEELGESQQALAAFGGLLTLKEYQYGPDYAANKAYRKAFRLFHYQRASMQALQFCDLTASRYPDTAAARRASFIVGQYYERMGADTEALKQYRSLATAFPEGEVARQCRQREWFVLLKLGRHEEALEVLDDIQANARNEDEAGYAHFFKGWIHYGRGVAHYPHALRELATVVNEYPNCTRARDAERLIAEMKASMIKNLEG